VNKGYLPDYKRRSFTLLELLIAITIITILAGAMVPLFKTTNAEVKITKAKADLDAIRVAALQFEFDTGTFVERNHGNSSNVNDPYCLADKTNAVCINRTNWKGPYIFWLPDPWGNPYHICGNSSWEDRKVHSLGPDGVSQGCMDDDICFWLRSKY